MKKAPKDIQMLGSQMTLEGTLVFEGTMIINGHVKGTIESKEGTIIIGEKAVIHADIYVHNAKVSGEVRGSVHASDRIELHPPARVYGNLTAPVVLMDAGVIFDGKCTTAPEKDAGKYVSQVTEKRPEGKAKVKNGSEKLKEMPDSAMGVKLGAETTVS